jgi:hypothetical protein
VNDLTESLRDVLGFTSLSMSEKEIPLQFVEELEPGRSIVRTNFISGYVEIVVAR